MSSLYVGLSGGNVGIGTRSATLAKTHISHTGTGDIFRVDDEASETTPFVINQDGNVGIGTTTTIGQVNIWGSGQTAQSTFNTASSLGGTIIIRDSGNQPFNGGAIIFGANQGNFAAIKSQITDGNNNTIGYLSFYTRTNSTDATLSQKIIITNDGKVGIGTTNPLSHLDVRSSASQQVALFQSTYTLNGNTSSFLRINNINATGSMLVGVDGIGFAAFETGASLIGSWTNNSLIFATNASEKVRILSNGNMGINITNPLDRLHVDGYIRCRALADTNGTGGFLVTRNASTTSTNLFSANWTGSTLQFFIDTTHVKTFVINHPNPSKKDSQYLTHACLEGPESSVYYRGRGVTNNGVAKVYLPDYFIHLVDESTATVQLTPIMNEPTKVIQSMNMMTTTVSNGHFYVYTSITTNQEFFWLVIAERKDISKLKVEVDKKDYILKGDGPYTYLERRTAIL